MDLKNTYKFFSSPFCLECPYDQYPKKLCSWSDYICAKNFSNLFVKCISKGVSMFEF